MTPTPIKRTLVRKIEDGEKESGRGNGKEREIDEQADWQKKENEKERK